MNDISADGILEMTVKHSEVYGVHLYFVADLVMFYTSLGPIFYEAADIELLRTFVSDKLETGLYQVEHGKLMWNGPTSITELLKTV